MGSAATPRDGETLAQDKSHHNLKESWHSPISEALLKGITTYSYYSAEDDVLILILDHARYTNHSDEPNSDVLPEPGAIGALVLRDIRAGEEIVENYNLFERCPWEGFDEDYWMPEPG